MKRIVILFILGIVSIGLASAGTVFIVITGIDEDALADNQLMKDMYLSLESGVMDVLFDAGFIVSNSGLIFADSETSLRLAKNAGANHLIIVNPVFEMEDESIITGISYSLVELLYEEDLAVGKLDVSDLDYSVTINEILALLGNQIAYECVHSL